MLEFHEKYDSKGLLRAVLVSDELKAAGSTCKVIEVDLGYGDGLNVFQRKTCNGSPGSTRYAGFATAEKAYAASRIWAKRKINAHQRDQKMVAAGVFGRFACVLGNPNADSRGYVR